MSDAALPPLLSAELRVLVARLALAHGISVVIDTKKVERPQGSRAARLGIERGVAKAHSIARRVVREVAGEYVSTFDRVLSAALSMPPGSTVRLKVQCGDGTETTIEQVLSDG